MRANCGATAATMLVAAPCATVLYGKMPAASAAARDSRCAGVKLRCSPVATPPGFTAFAKMPSPAHRRVASTANRALAVFDWAYASWGS